MASKLAKFVLLPIIFPRTTLRTCILDLVVL